MFYSPMFPTGRKAKRIYIYVESVGLNHKLLNYEKKHLLTTAHCAVTNSEAPVTPAPWDADQHNPLFLGWRL